jgi:hypothetical protein
LKTGEKLARNKGLIYHYLALFVKVAKTGIYIKAYLFSGGLFIYPRFIQLYFI